MKNENYEGKTGNHNHKTAKHRTLTKEKIIFYIKRKKYCALKEQQESGRPLSCEEKLEEEKLITDLRALILNSCIREAEKILMRCHAAPEDYFEIRQRLLNKFYEKLDEYDPLPTPPATFFNRHFRETISDYLSENKLLVPQHRNDSSNYEKREH